MDAATIKNIREQLHYEQNEFAEFLGVDRITVWRWESGRSQVRGAAKKTLLRLAEKLAEKAKVPVESV